LAENKKLKKIMTEKTYKFGKSKLTLRFGDITTTDTQVIVSSDDYYLSMGGGVSASILRAGGNEIALDAAKKAPAELGDVVITTAGRLKSKFILHVITIGNSSNEKDPKEIIKSATLKCLKLLSTLNVKSISFPALGTGVAGFDYEDVAIEMSNVISEYLTKSDFEYEVVIYLFDRFGKMQPIEYMMFFEAFASKAPQIAIKEVNDPIKGLEAIKPTLIDEVTETEQEIKSKRLHNLRNLLGALEDQRNRIEEKLISQLEDSNSEEYQRLKSKLKENEELRLTRLKELKDLTEDVVKPISKSETPTVFLSSTYNDLIEHRKAIKDQIARRKMIFVGMEYFGANPENFLPAGVIIEEVKKADVYIGVFGVRYGNIDQATGLSMTELEYREAKSGNKPMLLYIIKESANVKVSDIEQDILGREKLKSLKEEIMKNKVVYLFDTIADLERQVYADLDKIKIKQGR
jgi:O-acetyl-ADP-ribose deacetylase (regulator of RNase III)